MRQDTKVTIPRRRTAMTALIASVALCVAGSAPAMADFNPILGAWPIDEGAGQTVRDLSGKRNNGVLGATTAADAGDPAWIALPGSRYVKRNALRFGGDDYVTVADSLTLEPKNISVGAVVRATGSPGPFRYVVSKGALQCQTASYGLYTGTDGGLIFYVSNGLQYVLSADAGKELWDGAWHVVLGTFDGGRVRLFVDGKEVGTETPTSILLAYGLPDNDAFYIGDYRGTCASPLGFVGDIDAVAVADRAITWTGG
jgi:Concanavalin A-like lectin/glucanases superfamily